MTQINFHQTSPRRSDALMLATSLAVLTILALASLHVLSPELDPSWRMVSEYANGRYGWVLAGFFLLWAASTWCLAYAVWPISDNWLSKTGLVLLIAAGIGEAMAAAFDINHPLHMVAAIIGMNSLPVAAILLGIGLGRSGYWGRLRTLMRTLSWLPLLSVLIMAGAMLHFFSSLSDAGVTLSPESKPLTQLPLGITAYGGWANRLLIVAYCVWAIATALQLRAARRGD